jgi:hypothetical protein
MTDLMEGAGARADASQASTAGGGLRETALEYERQAWEDHRSHDKHARWAHWTHLGVGGIGVVAGVVAGGSAIADEHTTLVVIAAFISALAVGLQTFLNPGKSASDNWRRAAGLATVSRRWHVVATAPEEPTKEQFNELLGEWEKLETP